MTNPSSFDRHPDWVVQWGGGYIYNYREGDFLVYIQKDLDLYRVVYKPGCVRISELQARVLAAMHPDEVRRWAEGRRA